MFSTTPPALAALRWADRLYSHTVPLPSENPCYQVLWALNAYRQVARRYPSERASIGIGNCLMLLGHYLEAARAYPDGWHRDEARRYWTVARACAPFAKERAVLRVARVPGSGDRWIAMAGNVTPSRGDFNNEFADNFRYPEVHHISVAEFRLAKGKVVALGEPVAMPDQFLREDCQLVSMYVSNLELGRRPAVIVYRDFGGGDNDTNDQWIYAIQPRGLTKVHHFWGKSGSTFYPVTKRHGLLAVTVATWKVWWSDVYEWRGGRFVFANGRNPQMYSTREWCRPDKEFPLDYHELAINASLQAIWGHPGKAIILWRRAARRCVNFLHGKIEPNGRWEFDFYGDPDEDLREARKRIRWLRRGDGNHMLLYRPYDWDVEVPPYKLGKSPDR